MAIQSPGTVKIKWHGQICRLSVVILFCNELMSVSTLAGIAFYQRGWGGVFVKAYSPA